MPIMTGEEYLTACKLINESDLGFKDKFELRITAWHMLNPRKTR